MYLLNHHSSQTLTLNIHLLEIERRPYTQHLHVTEQKIQFRMPILKSSVDEPRANLLEFILKLPERIVGRFDFPKLRVVALVIVESWLVRDLLRRPHSPFLVAG